MKFIVSGLTLIILFVAASASAQESQPVAQFKLGADYSIVAKPVPAAADVELFYWYGSKSSLQIEYLLQSLQQQHPTWTFRRTPLIARPGWRAQSYFEPLFEQLAESGPLPERIAIYRQCLSDCSLFADYNGVVAWLKQQMQLDELPPIDESRIWEQSKDYQVRAKKLAIWQVPTIIVRGRYQLGAKQMQTPLRAQQLIEFLHQQSY